MRRAIVQFDGGSRGNPGPSASACIVKLEDGNILSSARYIGETTNNVAEYVGLLMGLKIAADAGIQEVQIMGDSKLVICQIRLEWRCLSEHLLPFRNSVRDVLRENFLLWSAHHVPRKENSESDKLVNEALDLALSR